MADISPLEMSVAGMFAIYMKHKGNDDTLCKQEFAKLLKEEMPSFTDINPEDIFKMVDFNSDGKVEFQEFAMLIAMVASAHYETLQALSKQQKK